MLWWSRTIRLFGHRQETKLKAKPSHRDVGFEILGYEVGPSHEDVGFMILVQKNVSRWSMGGRMMFGRSLVESLGGSSARALVISGGVRPRYNNEYSERIWEMTKVILL